MLARHPNSSGPVSGTRLGSKCPKVRADSKTGIRFCKISVRSSTRSRHSLLLCQADDVSHWTSNSYQKAGSPGSSSHASHSMAPKEELACSKVPGERNSGSKGCRGIPSWNLSLVLHQLTKAPFEPLKQASLKHLTFKTVFLLALGSGKCRSKIHAWLNKNIRHQADWSKVLLYPSPSFLSKNQLAQEGPASVAPVAIPAMAPTLDKSLKEDRSLCPVRALRYYLDKTKDLRQNKELVFVFFKQGFSKDTSPATISSWIKKTIILCYELADQENLDLHQVKAHEIQAFAASKAFQGGVSLDQILSACHWKSHNTFIQFYLKDIAWADSELFHLGTVVVFCTQM